MCSLAVKLATQWELMTQQEVMASVADGRDKCSQMSLTDRPCPAYVLSSM